MAEKESVEPVGDSVDTGDVQQSAYHIVRMPDVLGAWVDAIFEGKAHPPDPSNHLFKKMQGECRAAGRSKPEYATCLQCGTVVQANKKSTLQAAAKKHIEEKHYNRKRFKCPYKMCKFGHTVKVYVTRHVKLAHPEKNWTEADVIDDWKFGTPKSLRIMTTFSFPTLPFDFRDRTSLNPPKSKSRSSTQTQKHKKANEKHRKPSEAAKEPEAGENAGKEGSSVQGGKLIKLQTPLPAT